MNELVLAGCRPEPLGSYLKALGVLRLVGEQKDREARGRWSADVFLLATSLDRDGLLEFFLNEYRPTPIVSPWNSGSGFRRGGKRPDAERSLESIETSIDARLEPYRATIEAARRVVEEAESDGWRAKDGKKFWQDRTKPLLVEKCRACFPDVALAWLDAAVVLAEEPEFKVPLLGTGGNLGSQDLSNGFMQRLIEALTLRSGRGAPSTADSQGWLGAALFADAQVKGVKSPIGQFDPGAAGGVNSSPLGQAESLVNPWEFIMLMEGALLFASAAARKLGLRATGTAAMPFMFRASPVGYATASVGESSASEIWTPLWSRPSTAREVGHLIGEGRSDWNGRQARTGVEMAKAVASLGVDRGVEAFARHIFAERHGQNPLAVPVGRVTVRESFEVPVLAGLDRWTWIVRRGKNPPLTVQTSLSRIDAAMFGLAERGGPGRLQNVLVAAAEAETAVARSTSFRAGPPEVNPVQGLRAADWVPRLDDGSPEFRLAAALASQYDDDGSCLRFLLRPVAPMSKGRRLGWSEAPPPVMGFGARPIDEVLCAALVRRTVMVAGRRAEEATVEGAGAETAATGVQTAFAWRLPLPEYDVAAFLARELDDARFERLFGALMLLNWHGSVDVSRWFEGADGRGRVPEPAWALLAPFFHGRPIRMDGETSVRLRPEASWPAQLSAGRVEPVVGAALRRLRMAKLDPAVHDAGAVAAAAADGPRLGTGLLCPLSGSTVASLLRRTVPRPIE